MDMAFYASAYSTTVGAGFLMDKVRASVSRALIATNFAVHNNAAEEIAMPIFATGVSPTIITPYTEEEMSVPVFTHPLFVDISSVKKNANASYMVSDARAYLIGKPGRAPEKIAFRNKSEFDFTRDRTILSSYWYKGNTSSFKFLSDAVVSVYTDWISNTIARIFALDGNDQQYVKILTAYFWQTLFSDETSFTSEQEQLKMVRLCSKISYADAGLVLDVLGRCQQMANIVDLCDAIQKVTDNPRLSELNAGVLINSLHTSWMGNNGREIAAVSLEHVPTFVMMVYSAFTERSYRRTPLGRIVEKYRGNKGESEFTKSMSALLKRIAQDE